MRASYVIALYRYHQCSVFIDHSVNAKTVPRPGVLAISLILSMRAVLVARAVHKHRGYDYI